MGIEVEFLDITLGQVVYSKAGRDTGRMFLISGIENEIFVYISDGDLRRIEKPKRKKIKHLRLTNIVAEPISSKLIRKIKVSNAEIRKALEVYREQPENLAGGK